MVRVHDVSVCVYHFSFERKKDGECVLKCIYEWVLFLWSLVQRKWAAVELIFH